MQEKEIRSIITEPYNFQSWKPVIDYVFPEVKYERSIVLIPDNSGKTVHIHQKGNTKLTDGKNIIILEVKVKADFKIAKNRVGFHELTAKYIDQANNHGILIFYFSEDSDQTDYRLSFICRESKFNDDGEVEEFKTHPKRYTYILGENESGQTAAKRLKELAVKKDTFKFELKDVIDAFSVEKLNNEFFKRYKEQYEIFNRYLIDNKKIRYSYFELNKKEKKDERVKNELPIRDFTKKLLGRLVFLHFLQKKGWMGVPAPEKGKEVVWKNGKQNFLHQLFNDCKKQKNFHSQYLSELFFHTLNNEDRKDYVFLINKETPFKDGNKVCVPYLNGGLFDDDFPNGKQIDFPVEYFKNLFEFLDAYNFTIDENSPEDHDVGIDPEMLGHIFENLLEDNKDKGAYYTPKEVVHYMSQQSLIEYLKGKLKTDKKDIEIFIKQNRITPYITQNIEKIKAFLTDIKICDPAIGSGAFPMGILKEIFEGLQKIHDLQNPGQPFEAAKAKKHIIQHSIYGVDLEKGAVDIARLRFWLALVVDEEIPQPLPNLDYKIMQGNSVLEKYGEVDLSKDASKMDDNIQVTLFDGDSVKKESIYDDQSIIGLIDDYFKEKNKKAKEKLHKLIDKKVRNHIEKSLETYETNLLLEIASLEKLIAKNTTSLNKAQTENYLSKSKEVKLLNIKRDKLERISKLQEELLRFEEKSERPYFLWHLYFKDVFDNNKFDIIIGNPPYIKEYTNKKAFDGLHDSPYYMGKMDIWYYFASFCLDLLNDNGGIQCFIAQNNWITSSGASKFRDKVLIESEILSFVDFGNYKVFQSAGIQTMIYLLKKCTPKPSYQTVHSRLLIDNMDKEFLGLFLDENSEQRDEYTRNLVTIQPKLLVGNYISFNDPAVERILNKINNDSRVFLTDKEVAQGIVAPQEVLNKKNAEKLGKDYKEGEGIFMLKNSELEGLNFSTEEINLVKPFFTTEQLGRYFGINENREWILYTESDIIKHIKKYPKIKAHLDRFESIITSDFRPYGLHRSRDDKFFIGEKILSVRKCSRPTFTYTDFDCYVSQTYFSIKTDRFDMKYLTAILNSKLIAYWLRFKGKLQGNQYQIDKQPLVEIPIAISTHQVILATLVDYILEVHRASNPQIIKYIDNELIINAIDEVINHCVNEIYFKEDVESLDLKILDSLQTIDSISGLTQDQAQEKIIQFYHWINEQTNPIRNKILKANIVSENLLAVINSHIN
jgi:adenine-specific DNA-methyltransferase